MTTTSGIPTRPSDPPPVPGPRRWWPATWWPRRRASAGPRTGGSAATPPVPRPADRRELQRLADEGRHAGRQGEPSLRARYPEPGPVLVGLSRRLGADMQLVHRSVLTQVLPRQVQRRQALDEGRRARARLADLQHAYDARVDEPFDPGARRAGEDGLDPLTLADRRLRERERQREPARRAVEDAERMVAHQEKEVVRLTTEIEGEVRLALSRAAELREHALAAVSVYAAAVVRHHPHGATLIELDWPAFPRGPEWARDFPTAMQSICGEVFAEVRGGGEHARS